jgi:ABC-2 type transport system ATP-binding protein
MQMITGNLAPTAGLIRVLGVDLLDQPLTAKRHLGYLPEIPPVYRDLTVDEFLEYCARLHRIRRGHVLAAVRTAEARTGLEEVAGRLIGNLSKGFQQRVGIAQAILHRPEVVILDEPTVGLDPIQIQEIRELIRELGRDHGVILSTHILSEVQAVCTHVQIINRGELVLDSSIERLDQRMKSSSLVLGLQQCPSVEDVEKLRGIQHVELLSEGRYRILHDPRENPAMALAALVVDRGWGLMELTPERRSMEDIFLEITQGPAHAGERQS